MCVWIGGEGRGWLSDCWVLHSGMTNDGEDHTENYRHNYQDDLPNRCFWMTEPWRPNVAIIHTNANATCHAATLPFFSSFSLRPNVNVIQSDPESVFFRFQWLCTADDRELLQPGDGSIGALFPRNGSL